MGWLASLNPEQKQAALHDYGPMLILAGAGSGKTTTLVSRTGRLITDKIAKPEEICVLTFTNKAARELKNRVQAQLPHAQGLWAGTFHSFGLEILRQNHKTLELPKYFGILDSSDTQALLKDILKGIKFADREGFDLDVLKKNLSDWRELGQKKSRTDDEYDLATEWLLPRYSMRKRMLGVVDFDDLLLLPVELFGKDEKLLKHMQNLFSQVMIDEFQDTNITQMKLIDHLVGKHQNITVVGDDDQSIYGWRGACVQNILDFPKRYKKCKVVRLEQNYRSTSSIINVANLVIKENTTRHEKQLLPKGEKGSLPELFIFQNDEDEIDGIVREIQHFKSLNLNYSDIAVLYRSNTQGAILEAELKSKNIPHQVSGGTSFLERKEVKDALAYLRCAFQPNDVSFRRIFNVPNRSLGETTVEKIHNYAQKQEISFFQASFQWNSLNIDNRFGENINQLHQALKSFKANLLAPNLSPGAVMLEHLKILKTHIQKENKDPEIADKKWRWIELLSRSLDKFIGSQKLTNKIYMEFVANLELKDTEEEANTGVRLMTLHACKGLEFPAVILIGLEEDILPHKNLGADIYEERRLFYVGLTRAKKYLTLTRCKERKVHGMLKRRTPSRFLLKINSELMLTHTNGFRPVQELERKSLMSDLFKKLEKQSEPVL